MNIELIAYTPDPEKVIERGARTCYKSKEKDAEATEKFIKGIVKAGHESVIEHASATFKINGISRALTHQLVRHRHFSFSQQSQRYCSFDKITNGMEGNWYVTPESVINSGIDGIFKYNDCMQKIVDTYKYLVDNGVKPEDARFLLPNAAKTEIVVTGNFREWRHFIEMRADIHAQWEIRELAKMILTELYKIAPAVFEDLVEKYKSEE